MTVPHCRLYKPTLLNPTYALFGGMVDDYGGSPGLFRFLYRDWNHLLPANSPYWPFTATGQEFWWKCEPLSFLGPCYVAASVTNVDGMFTTGYCKFMLPTPTKPMEGAPWYIMLQSGWFDDTHYHWTAHTDIPCYMRVLVGIRKPYISPTTHVTRGIVFHHDPILHFRWRWLFYQNEVGDDITHTFDIPYYFDDVTYWLVATATVDGKQSPSYSPPYSFRRFSVPVMKVFDPVDITENTALLIGALWDDKGAPAYYRFQWSKVEAYTEESPVEGPESMKHWFNYAATDLVPSTEYKVRTIGSHDKSMVRYGYCYPKYFTTLSPPQEYVCDIVGPPANLYEKQLTWPLWHAGAGQSGLYGPSINTGSAPWLGNYHGWRSLFRFDTSIIPVGSTIKSAYIKAWGYLSTAYQGTPTDTYVCFVEASGYDGSEGASWFQWLLNKTNILASIYIWPPDDKKYRQGDFSEEALTHINCGAYTSIGARAHRDILDLDIGFYKYYATHNTIGVYKIELHVFASPPP